MEQGISHKNKGFPRENPGEESNTSIPNYVPRSHALVFASARASVLVSVWVVGSVFVFVLVLGCASVVLALALVLASALVLATVSIA